MVLGPYLQDMAVFKQKMAIIWKWSLNQKIGAAQKSFRMCFYIILGGQKNFSFFWKKFFWDTL